MGKRYCRTPNCPNTVAMGYGQPTTCESCHQRLGLTDRQSRTGSHWSDWNRGTSTERGYGVAWRRIRDAVLNDEPLCRSCAQQRKTTVATQVHHIIGRADGGTDERSNLEPRCDACHRATTAKRKR